MSTIHGPDSPTMLVVDDDDDFLQLMNDFLISEGFNPLLCSRADKALAMARAHQPDGIMLDLWLQRKDDGRRLLAKLKQDVTTRNIPVIILSADRHGMHKDRAELRRGSVALIEKPFDLDVLSGWIHRAVSSRFTLDRNGAPTTS